MVNAGYYNTKEKRKSFQELEFCDAFMFSAMLGDEELCKSVLERILEMPIDKVMVRTENTLLVNPDYHGVRLDVYARDKTGTVYDVEMQTTDDKENDISRRSRYYQSQMDLALLRPGESYRNLPDSYVIFICTFDPFDQGLYRYTFREQCEERRRCLGDGSCKIFLNTEGTNDAEVSRELIQFLQYVKNASTIRRENEEILKKDELLKALESREQEVKKNRGLEERYMMFQEMLERENRAGYKDGHKEGENQVLHVISAMCSDGKGSEVARLTEPEFRAEMFARYPVH